MAARQQSRASSGIIGLQTVVEEVKPTILIGTSTARGAFTRGVAEAMSAGVTRPVIFPISNPTSQIEAIPADMRGHGHGLPPGAGHRVRQRAGFRPHRQPGRHGRPGVALTRDARIAPA
jgi:hypothetical protein